MNRHRRAIFIAVGHFGLSLGVAFLAFAFAWGAGLSDSYSSNSSLSFFTIILVLLQAPVALVDFAVIHLGSHRTSLPAEALVLLAVPSSLLYGYVISYLWRTPSSEGGRSADRGRQTSAAEDRRRRGDKT
jgi:hypothetical protein